jgi:hypothetical protein
MVTFCTAYKPRPPPDFPVNAMFSRPGTKVAGIDDTDVASTKLNYKLFQKTSHE